MSSNLIIWQGGVTNNPWGSYLATPIRNYVAVSPSQSAYMFDVRVMNKAISESGGQAAATDLGAITYVFKDMIDNNGKVTLPFG